MVQLRGPLLTKAHDLRGRANGRKSISEDKVVFKELMPLALRNHTLLKGTRDKTAKVCLPEMMEMLACLNKGNYNQSLCEKEIAGFNKCYEAAKTKMQAERAMAAKGRGPIGSNATLNGHQMNAYIKKFPFSKRDKVTYYEEKKRDL